MRRAHQVHHGVARLHRLRVGCGVEQVADHGRGAGRNLGHRRGTREHTQLVTGRQQRTNQRLTDIPGAARDQDERIWPRSYSPSLALRPTEPSPPEPTPGVDCAGAGPVPPPVGGNTLIALGLALVAQLEAQRRGFSSATIARADDFDGRFHFCRVAFSSGGGSGSSWSWTTPAPTSTSRSAWRS